MLQLGLGLNKNKPAISTGNPILAISNLRDVWESDYGVTVTGIGVSQWNSLNADTAIIQAVDARRPLLVAGQINGLPVVRFNTASTKWLYKDNYASTATMALAYVFNSDGSSPERTLSSFNHRRMNVSCYGSGGVLVRMSTIGDYNKNNALWYANNTYTIMVFSYNGSTLDTYINGQLKESKALPGAILASTTSEKQFTVGSAWLSTSTFHFNNDIAAVAVFNSPLTDVNRQIVEAYWSSKYNITLP